jgi:hypothetical protein
MPQKSRTRKEIVAEMTQLIAGHLAKMPADERESDSQQLKVRLRVAGSAQALVPKLDQGLENLGVLVVSQLK